RCDCCVVSRKFHCLDYVIGVSCELVRCLVVVCFIVSLNEVLGSFVLACRGERSQKHNTFCQGSIKVLNAEDTVHTVYTEDCHIIHPCFRSLLKDQGIVRIVVGQEQKLCAAVFDLGKLYGEVGVGVCSIGLVCYYFQSVSLCRCNKGIMEDRKSTR